MIYLNYAALCPTRPEAQEEVDATLVEFNSLLYSEGGVRWYEKKVAACRQDISDLLSFSEPSSVAFVSNASLACHLAFSFIDWKGGDIILTSTHENPSVRREMDWLAHRGVTVSPIELTSPDDLLTAIEKEISTQPIRAIVLSHVSHVDGRILPVSEIGEMAKNHETLFIVDGAQAVGHIPVNLDQWDFDLYFFPGHKWCHGPLGTGALIMKESFVNKNPSFAQAGPGWNGTRAGRLEIGTHNIGLIAGLAKTCNLMNENGLKTEEQEEVWETARKGLERVTQIRIKQWPGRRAPGILTFQCRNRQIHEMIMNLFENQLDIVAKPFLDYPEEETPAIRLSWSGAMEMADVSFVVNAIEKSLKEK